MRTLKLKSIVGSVAVALVLAGSTTSPLLAKAPAGRYTIAGGEVTDTKTGLIWRQAVNAGFFNHAAAITHCSGFGNGYRLPNIRELFSLIDESESYPAVDSDAFPDTPSDEMWSSTLQAGSATNAWAVHFADGTLHQLAKASTDLRVRCVR